MVKTLDIGALMSGQIFAWLMIFTRIGAAFILFPGIGEPFVQARIRLLLALGLSLILVPVLGAHFATVPTQPAELVRLLASEILVGIFFGTMLRFMLLALETAGAVIAVQASLSNASVFNPAMATQGTLPGAILGALGIVLLFSTGTEEMLIRGLVGTYDLFVPGQFPVLNDMTDTITQFAGRSFTLGAEIAAPFLVTGILMAIALGFMARLMPQLQIFALALPVQIMVGLGLFMISLSGMMLYWLQSLDNELRGLITP